MTRFLSLAFALLIAVTSQQMALARGVTRDAAGQIILCTGQGVVSVTLDAQGEPIGPVHICPDCALSFADTVAAPTLVAPMVVHMQMLGQTHVIALQTPSVHTPVQARGPPRSV